MVPTSPFSLTTQIENAGFLLLDLQRLGMLGARQLMGQCARQLLGRGNTVGNRSMCGLFQNALGEFKRKKTGSSGRTQEEKEALAAAYRDKRDGVETSGDMAPPASPGATLAAAAPSTAAFAAAASSALAAAFSADAAELELQQICQLVHCSVALPRHNSTHSACCSIQWD